MPLSFQHIKIRSKILLLVLGVTFLAVIVLGGIGYWSGQRIIQGSVEERLAAVRDLKSTQIRTYADQVNRDVSEFAKDPMLVDGFLRLKAAFSALPTPTTEHLQSSKRELEQSYRASYEKVGVRPPSDWQAIMLQSRYLNRGSMAETAAYAAVEDSITKLLEPKLKARGFYDLMLVDVETGRLVYTVAKEAELGRNYQDPGLGNSILSQLISRSKPGTTRFSDFHPYPPSHNEVCAFLSSGVVSAGKVVAVVIVQFKSERLSDIMDNSKDWESIGLGETGETYLVGNDRMLRSNSRLFESDTSTFQARQSDAKVGSRSVELGTTVGIQKAQTSSTDLALAGQAGCESTVSYLGEPVQSCYAPIPVFGNPWAIVVEQSNAEAFASIRQFQFAVIGATTLLALLAAWLSVRVANYIVRPITRVTEVVHQYGLGESEARVPNLNDDELGELGDTINRMIENLEHVEDEGRHLRQNIVHDLKNPVAVIKGTAESLLNPAVGGDEEIRQEFLENIVETSDRLLDDLKDILEPIDELWQPQVEPFDLAQLANLVVAYERRSSRSGKHRLVTENLDQEIAYTGDVRKLRRVLENFLSNAIKYSPGEGKTVTVRLVETESEYRIEFEDQGIGMDEKDLAKVLSQGGRVVDHRLGIEGTGIGVQSCVRVLVAHGGRLEARSKVGEGTVFVCVLPRKPNA